MIRRFAIGIVLLISSLVLVVPLTAQPFAKPNLVVIIVDTPVLGSAGGGQINNLLLKACQTYFAVERSTDGNYIRLTIAQNITGWVAISAVQDVSEDYGQKNGQPANCSGSPFSASTTSVKATAVPTAKPAPPVATAAPSTSTTTKITPNLVLIVADTPLLSSAGGGQLGTSVAKRCQTFFVVERSSDSEFYRLQITTGFTAWVSASATQDVDENYGQAKGQARVC